MLGNEKITIILTTFNRANLVGETLDSIIAQTYNNWECFIIDDNSIDNTKEIVESYIQKDARFSFYAKGAKYTKGLSASRNMGMDLIEALSLKPKYIQFFDDDDIMHPQKFEIQVKEFEKNNSLDLTIFPTKNFYNRNEFEIANYVNFDSRIIKNIAEDFFLARTLFTAQVPLIRYNYIKDIRFNEALFYAEEWEVFNKLFFTKKTVVSYVSVPLYYHRKHEMSITANLYGKTNIKEVSKCKAFVNVYHIVKNSKYFNGLIFTRFISFAIHNKQNCSLFSDLISDLKKSLLGNKIKEITMLFLLNLVKPQNKRLIKLIQRISRL